MNRILITGGLGYVGGRLARRLSEEHEVWVSSRKPVTEDTLLVHGNVRGIDHAALFDTATFPTGIDAVIHLAALNEIDSVNFPSDAIRVNIDETRIILENSIKKRVERFIYFSTAHIYGTALEGNVTEESLPWPTHPYAITHRAAEDYIIAATKQLKIRGTILRLSNSFGAPVSAHVNRWTLLANDLSRQAVEKGTITLRSNGCQYRDFICLTDVEEVLAKMLTNPRSLQHIIYNLGSGISMRVIDMADAIIRSAVSVLKRNIILDVPAEFPPTKEPVLDYSIGLLISEGFHVVNDVNVELERLLQFCKENFSTSIANKNK
jgi:UDP-glucose 4-epimerase